MKMNVRHATKSRQAWMFLATSASSFGQTRMNLGIETIPERYVRKWIYVLKNKLYFHIELTMSDFLENLSNGRFSCILTIHPDITNVKN